jgi:hypothetical protein
MNQRLIFNLEKEVNGNLYRLCLPLGVQWTEALEVIKEFHEASIQLAQQATEKAAQEAPKSEEKPAEPIEVVAEEV